MVVWLGFPVNSISVSKVAQDSLRESRKMGLKAVAYWHAGSERLPFQGLAILLVVPLEPTQAPAARGCGPAPPALCRDPRKEMFALAACEPLYSASTQSGVK